MKTILGTTLASLIVLATPAHAASGSAPAHPFGLGLVVGAPTGLSAKLYLAAPFALQMGIGVVDDFHGDGWDDDALQLNIDAIWHPAILTRNASVTLPFYLGVGGRFTADQHHYRIDGVWYDDDHSSLGVRVPFGLLIDFNRVPLDIFFEVAVVVDLVYFNDDGFYDHDRVGLNGGIGLRYYF